MLPLTAERRKSGACGAEQDGMMLGEWVREVLLERADVEPGAARLGLPSATVHSSYETCTSLPFGDALTCSGSDPSPIHFTGKERDSESGLDNFGARYLGSSMGRFMSPDPDNAGAIDQDPQTWNAYSYARNNPLRYTDPDGLRVQICDTTNHCTEISDADFKKYFSDAKNVTIDKDKIYIDGKLAGTNQRTSFDGPQGIESANAANFAIGGLFKSAIEGGIGLLEGLFGSGARQAAGQVAGAAADAGSGATEQVIANGAKGTVRQLVEESTLNSAQKAAVKSALNRAGSGANVTVEKLADGSVRVLTERAGRVGSQVIEKVIDGAGNTSSVVQKAYDAAGNLVHVDPKFP